MRSCILHFAFCVAFAACLHQAAADTVYLKNGKTLEGEVIKDDGQVVIIRVTDGEVKLRAADVEAIERDTPLENKLAPARRQLQLGNLERAVSMFEDAWRENSDAPEARRMLASAYALQGRKYKELNRFAEAELVYGKLLKLDPQSELTGENAARAVHGLRALKKDADGRVARARALAGAEDWSAAIAAFEQAVAFTPDVRAGVVAELAQCYVKRATRYAHQGSALNAAADIEAALKLDPALADKLEAFYASCALPGIMASLGKGNLAAAQLDLKRVLELAPLNRSVLYVAGRMEEALGHLPAAANSYALALRTRVANPTPEYTQELRRRLEADLGFNDAAWKIDTTFAQLTGYAAIATGPSRNLETEHFCIVHYNDELAREVAARAEAARERVLSALSLEGWQGKARFFIHRTQAEYAAMTGEPEWTGGYSKIVGAGLSANLEIHSWQTSPRLLTCVLPHETTHLVIYSNSRDTSLLPMCLHEGFAVMMEPRFRGEYFMDFLRERLKRQDFIPLAELLARSDYPHNTEVFYAEGYALLECLVQQKGFEAAVKLLKNILAKGEAAAEILRAFGAKALPELETRWKAWILKPKQ